MSAGPSKLIQYYNWGKLIFLHFIYVTESECCSFQWTTHLIKVTWKTPSICTPACLPARMDSTLPQAIQTKELSCFSTFLWQAPREKLHHSQTYRYWVGGDWCSFHAEECVGCKLDIGVLLNNTTFRSLSWIPLFWGLWQIPRKTTTTTEKSFRTSEDKSYLRHCCSRHHLQKEWK